LSPFCFSINHLVIALASHLRDVAFALAIDSIIDAALQAQLIFWPAPSISEFATVLSRSPMSRAAAANMLLPCRVDGAILMGRHINVHEMTEKFAVKPGCIYCILREQLYLGPSISSGRTQASNCCSVQ
jgi:hypothetical protein